MRTVTKTYGHECGLSATFRQWRATSHCRFIHGYALAISLTFACKDDECDENGWVINFGGLKPVKAFLESTFDHKYLVAKDDPALEVYRDLAKPITLHHFTQNGPSERLEPLIQLVEVDRTGCEAFAEMVYNHVNEMLEHNELGSTKAKLIKVEVREHGANAASFSVPFNQSQPLTISLDVNSKEMTESFRRIIQESIEHATRRNLRAR